MLNLTAASGARRSLLHVAFPARSIGGTALAFLLLLNGAARAGDPVAGMGLFNNIPDAVVSCSNSSCHGPNPNDNVNGLQKGGNNAGVIQAAIKVNVPSMMFLNGLLNPIQLDDLAAYLAPQPDLSGTSLDFGGQAVATSGARQSITLRSIGGVDLVVTAMNLAGSNASEFDIGGDCAAGIVLSGANLTRSAGSCEIAASFSPSGTGARSARLTLAYAGNATFPGTQTIALTGVGTVATAAKVAIAPERIEFGDIVWTLPSRPSIVTIANTGNAPLQISGVDIAGQQAGEFSLSGTCVDGAAPVAIGTGGSCTLSVQFVPAGFGLRTAALRVTHNAADSPAVIPLTGVGIAPTCPPPAPPTEFRTLGCPAGQNGTIAQSRDSFCVGTTWTPGPWTTLANNCRMNFPAAPRDLVEYLNAMLDHYFITADAAEGRALESGAAGPDWGGKVLLGHVWDDAAVAQLVPVCRFYGNPASGSDGKRKGPNSHFYTADPDECAAVKSDAGWIFEGIVFHVGLPLGGTCAAPLVPVTRIYNGRFRENDSNHRYATDPAIVEQMRAAGWTSEGVVFCIAPP